MRSTRFRAQCTIQFWMNPKPRQNTPVLERMAFTSTATPVTLPKLPLNRTKNRERIVRSTSWGGALTTARAQAHRTAAKPHPRRIAIFGGSFDPIHNGHLSVARAADRRFNFDELHFVPASRPPHKLKQHLAPFPHRFAMVALACTEPPHFVPSLAEAGEDFCGTQLHYSVDTVRYFRHAYHGAGDRIFFIIGADAFLDIPMWKEYESLLGLCDFVIANRPGIRAEALKLVIPPDLMAAANSKRDPDPPPSQLIAQLRRTSVYLLENVSSDVSATDIRRRAHKGQAIHGLVSARVEEYIHKQGLYS